MAYVTEDIELLCECSDLGCRKRFQVGIEEAQRVHQDGKVLIANDCPHGPEQSDELVEKREHYSVYIDGLQGEAA